MEDAARFHVSWYEENPVKKLSQINILKGRERVAKLEMHMNSSHGGSEFRLGKTVGINIICQSFCSYQSLSITHFIMNCYFALVMYSTNCLKRTQLSSAMQIVQDLK